MWWPVLSAMKPRPSGAKSNSVPVRVNLTPHHDYMPKRECLINSGLGQCVQLFLDESRQNLLKRLSSDDEITGTL